jgi:dihydroflavonol-4-reductase
MRVLITGAAGLLGNNLARLCIAQGYQVTALDLNASTAESLADLDIEKIDANVCNPQAMHQACQDQDYVCHLAAVIILKKDSSNKMWPVNVDGTRITAQAALDAKVKRFIHISSCHAFSIYPHEQRVDETRTKATSTKHFDYDRGKAHAEIALQEITDKGLDTIILNPVGIIGPHSYKQDLTSFGITSWFDEKAIVHGNAGIVNYYVDARDLAQTIINTFTKGQSGENYIIASDDTDIAQLAKYSMSLRPQKVPVIKVPMFSLPLMMLLAKSKLKKLGIDAIAPLQICTYCKTPLFDDTKARQELGHQPRPICETIKDMYDWYMQRKSITPDSALASAS